MIFLGLIAILIVLSAVMAAMGISVTTEVVEPVETSVSETYDDAGSRDPSIERKAADPSTRSSPRPSRSGACCPRTASGRSSRPSSRTSTTSGSSP
ncbi:hypothetical protein [Ornithinibacter aureus]|uniref:hypothetical protein n=1 Tax=Ornithinibacter aureus TaxID=622664 RepID=UPI0014793F21|nr:hypothetical protein [Ornithinibacter aureus]